MDQNFFKTIIGTNETGFFVGEGDCQIQFNQEEISSLYFAQVHSNAIAESFVNYCRMTIASGSLPSCFRQDLSPDEIMELQEDLGEFRKKFADALFKISLIFEL